MDKKVEQFIDALEELIYIKIMDATAHAENLPTMKELDDVRERFRVALMKVLDN